MSNVPEVISENKFYNFFISRNTPDIYKWSNYFELYEKYFSRFLSRPVRFLEIGVDRGGSSDMWKTYFGKDAIIVGIDILPECKQFEDVSQNRFIEIGDQSDPVFLQSIVDKYGYFDIILDDGSHLFEHQIKSLEILWNSLAPDGVYMVEDCHTSYYPKYDGWHNEKSSFIEYAKNFIDEVNAHHRLELMGKCSRFKDVHGVYCHSGVVVLEKKSYTVPYTSRSGKDAEKTSAVEEARRDCAYLARASRLHVIYWYLKVVLGFITFNKRMLQIHMRNLKARKILKMCDKRLTQTEL